MSEHPRTDFSVDQQKNQIIIKRQFLRALPEVWAAWTKAELLDKWWAPTPWTARTSEMDFKKGGHWIYAMVSPSGEEHWARADYDIVEKEKRFTGQDAFSDAKGKINPELPVSQWDVNFQENEKGTLVTVVNTYQSTNDLNRILEMGIRDGFINTLENLDDLLAGESHSGNAFSEDSV